MPSLRLSILILLSSILTTTGFTAPRFNTVVIDPGHGGIDSGAVWYGTEEKNITLPVSKLLRKELLARGIKNVVMTREEDVVMGLAERAEFSNKHDRPIFISIHFNANLNNAVTGIATYIMPKSEGAAVLAEAISGPLRETGRRYLGVKTANLKVLRTTDHPAVIIEGGFLSNRGENWLIRTDNYQRMLTAAIADGILAYQDSPITVPATELAAAAKPEAKTKLAAAPKPAPSKVTPTPQPKSPPKLEPIPKPKAQTIAEAPPEDFRLQFGAFSFPTYAASLSTDLKGKGIDVVILKRQGKTKTFHRVVSQRTFSDQKAAGKWADQLLAKQIVETVAVTR